MSQQSASTHPQWALVNPIEWPKLEFQQPGPDGFVYGFLFRIVGVAVSVLISSAALVCVGYFANWTLRPWMLVVDGLLIVPLVFLTEHFRSRAYERLTESTGRVRDHGPAAQDSSGVGRPYESLAAVPQLRVIDIAIAGLVLFLLAPVLTLVAVLIKMDSRGPVFRRSLAIGQHGRRFPHYKFRTMRQSDEFQDATGLGGRATHFKLARDPRVTRVGTFLRSTDLDEIPALFNVFVGDMSLVGTRIRFDPREFEVLPEGLRSRILKFKPGLISYRSSSRNLEVAAEEELRFLERSFPVGTIRYAAEVIIGVFSRTGAL